MEIDEKGLKNECLIRRADISFTIGSFILIIVAFLIAVFDMMRYTATTEISWISTITLMVCAGFGFITPLNPKNMSPWVTVVAIGITIAGFMAFIWQILVALGDPINTGLSFIFYLVPLFGMLLVTIGSVCALIAEYPDEPHVSTNDNDNLTLSPELSKHLIDQLIDPDEDIKPKRDAFLKSITNINPTDESNKLSFTVDCENNELFKDLVDALKKEKG